jgi:hypothetical protein
VPRAPADAKLRCMDRKHHDPYGRRGNYDSGIAAVAFVAGWDLNPPSPASWIGGAAHGR